MPTLLKTFYDIILLRKGPEDLPSSVVLLAVAALLWCLTFTLAYIAFDWLDSTRLVVAAAASLLAIGAYQFLLLITGRSARTLQTQTALIGCGSVISLVYIALLVLSGRFGQQVAIVLEIVAQLVSLWSVPVKGHIIGRAIDVHWYVGIGIAGAVFILQYLFTSSFTTAQ